MVDYHVIARYFERELYDRRTIERQLVPKAPEVLERRLDDLEEVSKRSLAVLRPAGRWTLEPVSKPDTCAYRLRSEIEHTVGGDGAITP